ncbi:hypothetical protein Y1Q_0014438 [Alligator mississippiensis]|uniref:Uncharacterized protein n=1 Tax=Alligator mississippiensis TaxID=8496 RepID=A0A151PCM9_ALLMI|nr:hypothetical protein Y1Q_0014438 [Alligator mississippiensis]
MQACIGFLYPLHLQDSKRQKWAKLSVSCWRSGCSDSKGRGCKYALVSHVPNHGSLEEQTEVAMLQHQFSEEGVQVPHESK